MADPRAAVSYGEIDADYVTFLIDNVTITYSSTAARGASAAMLDKAVTFSADGTVALAADGDAVIGRIDSVEWDNTCRVQVEGFMQFPGGNGASLTRGKKIVGALDGSSAKGYVREVATGTAAELGKARGFIVESGTSTAVWVML